MKNTPPLVTIGIPTYNRADGFLKQAIKSAVSQTYSNIEIVVSDNCSTDHTENVVKDFNDKRIKYFRQSENIGANKNENFCLDQANGVYFLVLFDDDLIDCDFVEVCLNALKGDYSIGMVLTGAREIDKDGNVISECSNRGNGESTEEFCLDWFSGKLPLYACNVLMNTQRLREVGGLVSKANIYEDVAADVQLAEYFGKANVRDVKASFRRHDQNMGSGKIRGWCEDSLYLLDIMCKLASENKDIIRARGMDYFCKSNYRRILKIDSPVKKFFAYIFVFIKFKFHAVPPPIRKSFSHNRFYKLLSHIKKSVSTKL